MKGGKMKKKEIKEGSSNQKKLTFYGEREKNM